MSKFKYILNSNPEQILKQVKEQLEKDGNYFNGDIKSGKLKIENFVAKVEGTYTLNDKELTIDITYQSWTVSDNKIKEELDKFFKNK